MVNKSLASGESYTDPDNVPHPITPSRMSSWINLTERGRQSTLMKLISTPPAMVPVGRHSINLAGTSLPQFTGSPKIQPLDFPPLRISRAQSLQMRGIGLISTQQAFYSCVNLYVGLSLLSMG